MDLSRNNFHCKIVAERLAAGEGDEMAVDDLDG